MFPVLMSNGEGGPSEGVSLKEWGKYVTGIEPLSFHKNPLFLQYSNLVLRRNTISQMSAAKPASPSVVASLKMLLDISKSPQSKVPKASLRALVQQISAHVSTIPGSMGDTAEFRKYIFSTIAEHGLPTSFLTVSSADSFWPETFVKKTNGAILLDEARELSPKYRAQLLSDHRMRATLAFKARTDTSETFLINGISKPLGDVEHIVKKKEFQDRLSEHSHYLISTNADTSISTSKKALDEEILDANTHFFCHGETYCSALLSTVSDSAMAADSTKTKYDAIAKEAVDLHDIFTDERIALHIRNLQRNTQIHKCNNYCTRGRTQYCKSHFPFC